jgi:hypothetical protein
MQTPLNLFGYKVKTHDNKVSLRISNDKKIDNSFVETRTTKSSTKDISNAKDNNESFDPNILRKKEAKSSVCLNRSVAPTQSKINIQIPQNKAKNSDTILSNQVKNEIVSNDNDCLSTKSVSDKNDGSLFDDFRTLEEILNFIINVLLKLSRI